MITLDYRRFHATIPETWDEFTSEQLEVFARLMNRSFKVQHTKVLFLCYLLRLRIRRLKFEDEYRFRWKRQKGVLSAQDIASLTQTLNFLFDSSEDPDTHVVTYSVNSKLTRNPYPTLRLFGRKLYGPGDAFDSLTYDQFVYSQHYFSLLSDDPSALNYLLASLWHRHKVFDSSMLEKDSRLFRFVPKHRKVVMLWYFTGSMSMLASRFPRVFSGNGKSTGSIFENMQRIIDALASGDMTRKPLVRSGSLYDALFSMDESVRKNEEMERRMT